uniref:Uncharacterized protein n=1 Tax=Salix viminalis TaxID=40686 RepID=A0A6N2KKK7_SALVM
MNSIEFPLLDRTTQFQLFQLHQMIFQIGQDSPVYGASYGSRFDFDRMSRPDFNSRHSNYENGSSLVRLYEQMRNQNMLLLWEHVQLQGMFSTDSYSTMSTCRLPPKPEAIIDAITKLRKKISREIYEDRISSTGIVFYYNQNINK